MCLVYFFIMQLEKNRSAINICFSPKHCIIVRMSGNQPRPMSQKQDKKAVEEET